MTRADQHADQEYQAALVAADVGACPFCDATAGYPHDPECRRKRALSIALLHFREEAERHQGQPAYPRLHVVYQELVAAAEGL